MNQIGCKLGFFEELRLSKLSTHTVPDIAILVNSLRINAKYLLYLLQGIKTEINLL